jgi:hypothetical protein
MTDLQLLGASALAYNISPDGNFCDTNNSYFKALAIPGTFLHPSSTRYKVVKDNSAACILFKMENKDEKKIIISFRGTINPSSIEGLNDWFNNLYAGFTEWNNQYKVHKGFATEVDNLYPEIKNILLNDWNQDNKASIYITGHSQGGAKALLTAFKFYLDGISVNKIVTFAAPNVGGESFSNAYNQHLFDKTIRYQCARDIVPMLPPNWGHEGKITYDPSRSQQFMTAHNLSDKALQSDPSWEIIKKILNIITAFANGDLQNDILKTLRDYYAVGILRYINTNNELVSDPQYLSMMLDLIPGLSNIGLYHSLETYKKYVDKHT